MIKYTMPTAEEIAGYVREYDKRIGLRMLYSKYEIPKSERHKYRELYNRFYDIMPDAFGKEEADASESKEATEEIT